MKALWLPLTCLALLASGAARAQSSVPYSLGQTPYPPPWMPPEQSENPVVQRLWLEQYIEQSKLESARSAAGLPSDQHLARTPPIAWPLPTSQSRRDMQWLGNLVRQARFQGRITHASGTVETIRGSSQCAVTTAGDVECRLYPDATGAGLFPVPMMARFAYEQSAGALRYGVLDAERGNVRATGHANACRAGTATFRSQCTAAQGKRCWRFDIGPEETAGSAGRAQAVRRTR